MARHFTWCLARTLTLTNRLSAIRLTVPALKASEHVAIKPDVRNMEVSGLGKDIEEPRDIERFVEDSKNGIEIATTALMKILSITKENAAKAMTEFSAFTIMPKRTIYQNFDILRKGGMYKSSIKNDKFLLTIPTTELIAKVQCIKAIDIDINDAVYLFRLTVPMLKSFEKIAKMDVSYLPARNRLYYLSEKLKCDMKKLCNIISYNSFMLTLQPPKLLTFTEYMLESGIRPEHILSDLLIYRYSLFTLKSKIERAKELGMYPIRPWVVRCSQRQWRSAEERAAAREEPFDTNISREEHLCKIFKCSMEDAKYLLVRDPRIARMSAEKLVINAKLTHNEGYTFHDVLLSPLILQYSSAKLKKRFVEWNTTGLPHPRLFVFGSPEDQYRRILNNRLAAAKSIDES